MRRPSAAVVGLLAFGAITAPCVVGALALLSVGDLMRPERNWNESWRGRIALVLTAAVGGLLSWLPDPLRLAAIVAIAVAVAVLAYVPTILVDRSVGVGRAVARSIDLTCRADARSLASTAALSGFLVATPSLLSYVRSLGGNGYSLREMDGVLVATIVALSLAVVAAVGGCVAISSVSRSATQRPARKLSILGVTLAFVSLVAVVWLAAAPALVVRFDRVAPVASVPVDVVIDGPAGPFVTMRRQDGQEFALIAHHHRTGWSIDTADLESARMGILRSTPLADDEHGVVQARATVLIALAVLLLAGLAFLHASWLRRMFVRSHVVRVRLVRDAIVGAPSAQVVVAGTRLFVVDAGQVACLDAPIPISGTLVPGDGPDDSIDASLVTRGPWSTTASYRAGLSAPAAGARLIVGDAAHALDEARLDDVERFMVALSLAPVLAVFVVLLG